MSLLDSLGNQGMNPAGQINSNNIIDMINGRFGNIQNALNFMGGLLGKRQMSPRDMAIREIRGKHFSQDTINQFRDFVKKNGYTDHEIDDVLRQLGI